METFQNASICKIFLEGGLSDKEGAYLLSQHREMLFPLWFHLEKTTDVGACKHRL